jgi:DNA relaxase NicK
MNISIDWISVSFPSFEGRLATREYLADKMPEFSDWHNGKGRAPYPFGYQGVGASFYFKTLGALLEITGTGCHRIAGDDKLLTWYLSQKLTRIDICVDYEDTTPQSMVRDAKITGMFDTQSGYTAYLGSSKSDTMARIYKYASPHPRENLTRYEVVFRRKNAMSIAHALLNGDNDKVWGTMVNFARRRGVVLPDDTGDKMPRVVMTPITGDKAHAGTIRWLQKQVAPAINKLRENGISDKDIKSWLKI